MMGCLAVLVGILVFMGFGAFQVLPPDAVAPMPTIEEAVVGPEEANPAPPPVQFLVGDVAFPMNQGSYCWTEGDMGVCADMIPPMYTPDEHLLVIGNTMELLLMEPFPDTLTVSLYPGSTLEGQESIMADAVIDADGRVLVTVPDGLSGDYVLTVFTTWTEFGDSFYSLPVRFES